MKNKKQRKIFLYLLVILGITVGFALLSTTLYINGTAGIKGNTWNIHWDDSSVNITTGSVSAADPVVSTVTSSKDTVSFDVELEIPGDFYEFEIDAVNEGSVDGELDLAENWITYKSNNVETILPSYMDFKVTYDDDTTPVSGNVLKASKSQTYKIRVEYKSDVEELPSNPEPITIEVNLPYVQHKDVITEPRTCDQFSNDSWEDISEYIKLKSDVYPVGCTKSIDLDGYGTYTVRVANNTTPSECRESNFSQTACGFVLEFTDSITTYWMNPYDSSKTDFGYNAYGGWNNSSMRNFVKTTIYNSFPSEVKDIMIDTKIVSGHNVYETDNFETTDKLYLLAPKEIWGDDVVGYDSAADVSRQLDYYKEKDVNFTYHFNEAIKNNAYWWLRTPRADGYGEFLNVTNTGAINNKASRDYYGVSPAFRIG